MPTPLYLRKRPAPFVLACSVASLLAASALPVLADSFWNGTTSIDWNDPTNWSNGYPGATNAIVNPNGGAFPAPTISANAVTVNDIRVNDTNAGTATVNQTAGAITQTGWFRIATQAGGTGIFNMSGGTETVTGARVHIGESGNGIMNLSGGTINASGGEGFMLGANGGSTGTVNQTGGAVNKTNGWFSIGGNGSGTYNISGGSLSATGDFNVSDGGGSRGVLNVSGTGLVTSTGSLLLAKNANTTGLLNISGGTVNASLFSLGGTNNAANVGKAFATISGGQLNASGELWVGQGGNGNGLMDLNAGVVSTASWFAVGRQAGGFGVLNVSGTGVARMTGGNGRFFIVGSVGGTGILNLQGGSVEAPNGGDLRLSENAGGNGTANLVGGTLKVDRIVDNGATSYLYLSGATLQAQISSTTYLEGLDTAVVGAGNAIFDTNGKTITVNQTLLAPTNSGVTSIAVTNGGAGYPAQPVVKITGDGTGASGVANVVGGVVTSITITNPGINYTTASVTLIDGGATTAATVSAPVVSANVTTGGLEKKGLGTLILGSSNNSYLGVTTISNGTLSVGNLTNGGVNSTLGASSSAAGNLVFNGGALQYSGGSTAFDRSFTSNATKSATFDVSSAFTTLTLTGGGTGAGGLTKIGNGTLVLNSGASYNYTGTTNANGGVLDASGVYTMPFAVGNGGHLTTKVNDDSSTLGAPALTVPTLTLNTGSAVDFEFGGLAALNSGHDIINIANASGLTLGTTGLNLYQTGGTLPFTTNGTYTLFDYTTAFNGTLTGAFTIANSQVGKLYNITNNLGSTTIELAIGDAVDTQWNVDGGGLWTTPGNWTAGVPNGFGAIAKFLGVLSAPNAPATVTLNGPKTVGVIVFDNSNPYIIGNGSADSITFDNGSGTPLISQITGSHTIAAPLVLIAPTNVAPAAFTTLTLSGNISGAGSLAVTDAGTVLLTGTNTYGNTVVNTGNLNVGNGGTTGSLGTGPVSTGTGSLVTFNHSNPISIPNNITGGGSVTHLGTGSMTYTGNATYTGSTVLPAGAFVNEGTINGTTSLDVENVTTLRLASSTTVNGTATVANNASVTASLDLQNSAVATINGNLNVGSGAGSTGSVSVGGTTALTNNGTARFGNGGNGTLNVSGGSFNATNLFIGSSSTGTLNLTGGTTTSAETYIGSGGASTGMVNLLAGRMDTSRWTVIGDNNGSVGVVTQSGGVWNQNHTDVLSVGQNGNGTYAMSGNAVLNDPSVVDTTDRNTNKGNLYVGRWGTGVGHFTMTDNAVANIRELMVGNDAGSFGQVDLGGSSVVTSSYDFHIGRAGTGIVNINGGTLSTASGWTQIGIDAGGNGTLNMTAGSVSSREYLVGGNAKGTVTLSGGTLTATQRFSLGENAAGTGYLTAGGTSVANLTNGLDVGRQGFGSAVISGSSQVIVTNGLNVGNFGTSQGYVRQTGGALSSVGGAGTDWRIGGAASSNAGADITAAVASVGIYNISGGTFGTNHNFQIGSYGSGQMNVSGTGAVTITGGFPAVGRYVGGFGVLDVSGGSFTDNSGNLLIIGEDGVGTLNVRGGDVTQNTNNTVNAVSVGHTATGNGTLNLLSGTLSTLSVSSPNASASSTVNFNGGTLRATGSNGTFLQSLTKAYVYAGGGTIDTQANSVTILQDLLAPTGSGVTGVTVTSGGTGYQAAPIVKITGGGGTGATAVATINALGEVNGIIITNPGVNYSSAPLVTLVGGAPTAAAGLDPATLAANPTGTMTKIGTGTLDLNGSQGYDTLTTMDGVTNLNGAFSGGTSTIDAQATTNINVSQDLGALIIADGVTVTFGTGPEAAPGFGGGASLAMPNLGDGVALAASPMGSAVVPEPGTLGLLVAGALGILGRRRRR